MRRLQAVASLLLTAVAVAAPSAPAPSVPRSKPAGDFLPLPSRSPDDLAVGRFLIANRSLQGPTFAMTVILLLEHSPQGSLGVIVNRQTDALLARVLPDLAELGERRDRAWYGGPVELERMLILIRAARPPADAEPILEGVYASARLGTLRELLSAGEAEFRAYVGYAGWAPEQLEGEMARGDWYVAEADAAMVFCEDADRVWPDLIARSEGIHVGRPAALRLSRR